MQILDLEKNGVKLNPIPTRICHVIYCRGDKSYPCLVGIGLKVGWACVGSLGLMHI